MVRCALHHAGFSFWTREIRSPPRMPGPAARDARDDAPNELRAQVSARQPGAPRAMARPAGGRKLTAKSKPFWETRPPRTSSAKPQPKQKCSGRSTCCRIAAVLFIALASSGVALLLAFDPKIRLQLGLPSAHSDVPESLQPYRPLLIRVVNAGRPWRCAPPRPTPACADARRRRPSTTAPALRRREEHQRTRCAWGDAPSEYGSAPGPRHLDRVAPPRGRPHAHRPRRRRTGSPAPRPAPPPRRALDAARFERGERRRREREAAARRQRRARRSVVGAAHGHLVPAHAALAGRRELPRAAQLDGRRRWRALVDRPAPRFDPRRGGSGGGGSRGGRTARRRRRRRPAACAGGAPTRSSGSRRRAVSSARAGSPRRRPTSATSSRWRRASTRSTR